MRHERDKRWGEKPYFKSRQKHRPYSCFHYAMHHDKHYFIIATCRYNNYFLQNVNKQSIVESISAPV